MKGYREMNFAGVLWMMQNMSTWAVNVTELRCVCVKSLLLTRVCVCVYWFNRYLAMYENKSVFALMRGSCSCLGIVMESVFHVMNYLWRIPSASSSFCCSWCSVITCSTWRRTSTISMRTEASPGLSFTVLVICYSLIFWVELQDLPYTSPHSVEDEFQHFKDN